MNMSYCRFHNTSMAFQDCLDTLQEMRDNPNPDNALSSPELKAAKQLISKAFLLMNLCYEILGPEAEYMDEDQMQAAAEMLQDDCQEKDEDEE